MITSIPTAEDFRSTGIALINLAWESVITVAQNLAGAPVENWGDENDAETIATWKAALDGYLQSAQQALATAVALAQQGTEFLLKSKIAAVSPFLLISSSPGDWPKGCEKADTPFADFKTIDAQDLPRAHDCVCSPRLSEEFRSKFDQLRRLRNTVMHTVDRRARFTVQDGVLAILEVVEALVAPQGWVAIRRSHLQSTPALSPDRENPWDCLLAREITCVVGLLQPAEVRRFFGFNKRTRRYRCPGCDLGCADWAIGADLAVLEPNTPESTSVVCFLCGETYEVERRACTREECPGNVISTEWDTCLTCGLSG